LVIEGKLTVQNDTLNKPTAALPICSASNSYIVNSVMYIAGIAPKAAIGKAP
jgi:hypothetical protein